MKLERVIILVQHFNSFNSPANNRVTSWANNLHKYGYYPVLMCRNLKNNESVIIEKNEFYEVHFIFYKDAAQKRKLRNNKVLKKLFGLFDYLFGNSFKYNGISGMFQYISDYIKINNVKKMVATAPNYSVFGLANELGKKNHIKWIADYRDDWTTTELFSGLLFKIKKFFDFWREKAYLNSCTNFTTVSPYYIEKIAVMINKKGFLIENGFNLNETIEEQKLRTNNSESLTILYPGILYRSQKLDIIASALDILSSDIKPFIKFVFLGTEAENLKFSNNVTKYIGKNIFFRKRISKEAANEFFYSVDLMLFLTHIKNGSPLKGIPSSKLYNYIRLKKPVIMCFPDNDIVEEKLRATGQGIFCNNYQELADVLKKYVKIKQETSTVPSINIPDDIYYENTREYQTEKLASFLDTL